MLAWWSEHLQKAFTGNLSVSAIKESRDRKVVSIRQSADTPAESRCQ